MSGDRSDGLLDGRVILCLGSGGVGKTTIAAGLALALAGRGERVVVLTIDPARRLAESLGLSSGPGSIQGNEIESVEVAAGEVWATMLDPAATFEAVIRDEAPSVKQADQILTNPLFRNLTRSLSGTNEYMAAERLHQLYNDPRFDRVIVDTPPSRHALDFLDSPDRLSRFINHRLYRSVFAPRHGLMRTVRAGSQMMLRILGRLVGSRLVDDVVDFFGAFGGLDAGFDRRSREISQVLHNDTSFVLVTSPRLESLHEARWIADNVVERRGRSDGINAIIVNRLCPVDPDLEPSRDPSKRRRQDPLESNWLELSTLATEERQLVDEFCAGFSGLPTLVQLREQDQAVSDLAGLRKLSVTLAQQLPA